MGRGKGKKKQGKGKLQKENREARMARIEEIPATTDEKEKPLNRKQMTAYVYNKKEKLGEGGMATVFKGESHGQEIAVKIYKKSKRQQWETESNLLSKIQHKNIVKYIDAGPSEENKEYHLLIEFIDGQTLEKTIPELDWPQVVDILKQIYDGLYEIHSAKYIVGDIKPENVMITKDKQVRLIDFGSAVEKGKTLDITTVGYAAKEAKNGEEVNEKTDLFSFGMIILQLLMKKTELKNEGAFDDMRKAAVDAIKKNDHNIVHQHLTDTGCTDQQAREVMVLGINCTEEKMEERPNREVVKSFLDGLRVVLGAEKKKKKKNKNKNKKKRK